MTLSGLSKYSVTRSSARRLCDSWACCQNTPRSDRHGEMLCVVVFVFLSTLRVKS